MATTHGQYQAPLPNSDRAFPILPIALLSIMATAFLLVGFYVIANKCFSNFPQLNLLTSLTFFRARRTDDSFIALSPMAWTRGLDESIIREIPTLQYKSGGEGDGIRSVFGCVVCLNEFQEQEMLRVLPSCGHAFHLDCVDVWFQANANCPLCRTSISGATKYPFDHIIAPTSSPQGSHPYTNSLIGSDEDYVVIELRGENEGVLLPERHQERDVPKEVNVQHKQSSKMDQIKIVELKERKKHQHVSSMGDECIDVRGKDHDQFSIQPIRRSFSFDSAVDQQLYSSVQAIIQQNVHNRDTSSSSTSTEGSSGRVRRSLFPFGHGRGSKNAILPIEFEM